MSKASASSERINVLLASSFPADRAALEQIFRSRRWRLQQVSTCREAVSFATQSDAEVVICEQNLPDGDWKIILNELSRLSVRPSLIVTSRLADDALWAEVLNLGGYDVLAQPFDPDEVSYVVFRAWQRAHRRNGCYKVAT